MLKGKIAVITGGTRGIGLATAQTFLKNRATVIIFGSRKESIDEALKKLENGGYQAYGYYPNLSDYEEVENTINKIVKKFGTIDILINNAGISAHAKIEDTTPEEFASIMNLNVSAMFHTIKAVTPIMKSHGGGVILNTSSMVSIYGQQSGVGYPTSKFAVNGLTKSLARELAPYNIRVNAIAPGITDTDMVKSLPKEMIDSLIATIPLGRIGKPEDIANAFLFLASDLASYITGVILSVDGAARN